MAKTYAYMDTGNNAYVTLGHTGVALYIYSGDRVVGTLFVTKTGVRWLPKKHRSVRKGKRVVGVPISWAELNEIAANAK
jgi:hypothetical protein